ncbi:MAG: helix-turn-helix transcriptional regulator [Calditrichaeota bacterium]|nr:helix-turn-helix transcriptional regulator [Calditrichota bacterium]
MDYIKAGHFFGDTQRKLKFSGFTFTDTDYTHPYVDWHYHENAYFTFLLAGQLIEGNKKERYYCEPGTLLFHNWQDSHYNIKPVVYTRGCHIEFSQSWFNQHELSKSGIEGSFRVLQPLVKLQFYRIYQESRFPDSATGIAMENLLINLLADLNQDKAIEKKRPAWLKTCRDYLYEHFNKNVTLADLSVVLNLHPVHISREFSRNFQCNLGDFLRRIRIERSLALFFDKRLTLTDIAFQCGFSDQSHFLRTFKELIGFGPKQYRQFLTT